MIETLFLSILLAANQLASLLVRSDCSLTADQKKEISPYFLVTESNEIPTTCLCYSKWDGLVFQEYGEALQERLLEASKDVRYFNVDSSVNSHNEYNLIPFNTYSSILSELESGSLTRS